MYAMRCNVRLCESVRSEKNETPKLEVKNVNSYVHSDTAFPILGKGICEQDNVKRQKAD